jgi:hypothetical protein
MHVPAQQLQVAVEHPFWGDVSLSFRCAIDSIGYEEFVRPGPYYVEVIPSHMNVTPYQPRYFAHELTRRCASDSTEKLAGAVASAQVDLNPHQVDAALFAFSSPLAKGALLADEVGLGKTIEAGLVLSQKWAERKRRILVITPSNLRKQWFQEVTEKFFLPCRILEAKSYNAAIKQGNFRPFEANEIVICSYQFARGQAADVANTTWDLVVIDEAHRLRNVYKPTNVIANTLKRALANAPKLLLTEAGAEGINIQFCSLVVNYDLPWNPERIEQRIGRCHRYGQKHDVVVVNFLNRSNAADARVFQLLSEKFQLFEGVFGVSDEVLGAIGSGADFEKRIADIYQRCRVPDEIKAAFDQLQLELSLEINEAMTTTGRKLLENFDDEVREKLRLRDESSRDSLNRIERLLLLVTEHELAGHADFLSDSAFRLKTMPFSASANDIPLGLYELPAALGEAHLYRPNHPHSQRL